MTPAALYIERIVASILLAITPAALAAQCLKQETQSRQTNVELRLGADIEKHLPHHLSLSCAQEIRSSLYDRVELTGNGATETTITPAFFRSSYTTVGFGWYPSWKNRNTGNRFSLGLSASYTFRYLADKDTSKPGKALARYRHRAMASVSETWTVRQWKFSLRQRLQLDHRMDSINTAEKPKTALFMRYRLLCEYSCRSLPLRPYLSFELMHTLNQPATTVFRDEAAGTLAYEGQYVCALRPQVGLKWKINRRNALTFFYEPRVNFDRELDYTAKGNLKLNHATELRHTLSLSYSFDWL